MTLEAVQKDVESQVQQVQLVSGEVERLKQQLASEKKNVSETSMELQALKKELEKSKTEAENLKSSEDRRQARSKSRLELEDAKNTINELKEELSYKSNVNRSLGLQLEKTIESNSELLLEIKELDEVLQKREIEIEELKAELEERQGNQKLEDEKTTWMQKLEESEQERRELKKIILTLEGPRINQASDENAQELRADNEVLRKELEKADTELAEACKENMNLLSQLMALRHQTDEKEVMVQQLFSQLNDLREKLCLSEELSQSQLDSNKVFLEDLNSTVEGLRTRNEQLELLLKTSEERNAHLIGELEAQQKEILEHEKERSLLGSQRGQLKILREKISTITENYEIAMKRGEDLDLASKALREENHIALASLNEQLKNIENKLHESNTECIALREKMEEAETRARHSDEEVSLLLGAKEAAETTARSLHAEHAELQKQFASLVEAKENCDASLRSLQEALQEHLKDAEHISSEAIHQLQEHDEKLQLMQEEREAQNSRIEQLELELTHMKENLDVSNKSLSASEDRIQNLQLRNDDLAEMLQSAMSFKEDVVSRLEAAITKEAEMEQKLQETEQALHCAKSEKASCDQALVELQDRVRLLDNERNVCVKGKEGEQDKRKLLKISQAQLDALKASINDMKLEKEKAAKSLQKLQIENTSLAQDLKRWKEKVKGGDEELTIRKDKNNTSNEANIKQKRSNSSLDERDFHLLQDSGTKGVKKGTDVDQKGEVMKLRKNAADLRRKLLEQEEEKEDMRKKLASIQKEAQRKSDLLILTEKKLKEKEKEQHAGQRPPTRHSSNTSRRIGMTDYNMPHGAKAMADLLEKVKLLEGELNIKTVELEATKFVLKEKEAGLCSDSNMETENCVDDHADTHSQGFPNKLENQNTDSVKHGLLINAGTKEALLDEVRRLQMENQQLKNSLSMPNEESHTSKMELRDASEINMDNNYPLQCGRMEKEAADEEGTHLQEELKEMRERYSQMSLQFAELQVEKEELLVTIRNLSRDIHK